MTTTDPRKGTGTPDTALSIEAWLSPIAIGTVTSAVASWLGSAVMYMSYYHHRYGTQPNTLTGRTTVISYFWARGFLYCLGWSLLFVLSYREWPALRRIVDRLAGMLGIGAVFGTALWALMHYVIFPRKPQEMPIEVIDWLRYTLFIGPPIVWAVRRFSPLAPRRPFWSPNAASPEGGQRQIITGLVLAIVAALYLALFVTHPGKDYSLLLGLLLALGAVLVLGIATSLILGGIWTRRGWPGRALVRLSPLLLALSGAWYVYVR